MSDMNFIVISGRLSQNPEVRTTSSGVQVCDISVAVNRYIRKKGAKPEAEGKDAFEQITIFPKVTLWDKKAEWASKNLKTGNEVMVYGQLVTDDYTRPDGTSTSGRMKIDNVRNIRQITRVAKAKALAMVGTEEFDTTEADPETDSV